MSSLLPAIRQIVPSEACLSCDVCCRFPDSSSTLRPYFLPEEARRVSPVAPTQPGKISVLPIGDHHECPFFNSNNSTCGIYMDRPLDCRLYPFLFTADRNSGNIGLGLDLSCPYARDHLDDSALDRYQRYLTTLFSSGAFQACLDEHPGLTSPPQETVIRQEVPGTSKWSSWDDLIPLDRTDRALFDWYFSTYPGEGSCRTFAGQWVWSTRMGLAWTMFSDHVCLFARQGGTLFMPIPPIGPGIDSEMVRGLCEYMELLGGPLCSVRIENLSHEEAKICARSNLKISRRNPEFIYRTKDLAGFQGSRYKSHRALVSRFIREHPQAMLSPYAPTDEGDCHTLFQVWSKNRARLITTGGDLEGILLEDAAFAHAEGLSSAASAGLRGWTVRIGDRLVAYSLGAKISENTFAIMLEICDPGFQGLPQWLTREVARRLEKFDWINTMDDSGLTRLSRNKEGYRPAAKLILYNARRS